MKNHLHICFLCHEYPPARHGGIGAFTRTLATALAQKGHRISVVGLYPISTAVEESEAGIKVVRLPASRFRFLRFLQNSIRLSQKLHQLAASHPQTILEGQENAFAFITTRVPGCRVLRMHGGHHFFFTSNGDRPKAWRSWIERRSFAKANKFCAVSCYVAGQTRQLLRMGAVPIEVLPNPVSTERFRPMPEMRATSGLIVFVGTLCEKKGIRQLLAAMREIIVAAPDVQLLVCGRDTIDRATGKSYRQALQVALPAPVRQRVTFKDHVDNSKLPAELAAAEVLVYPSHMESQGIAVIEGMAMGKPVVASKTGPGPEIIEQGVSGLLCDPHDPHSIAQSLIRVLKDRELANRLGTAARRRAVAEFCVEKLVVRNEEFYFRCLEGNTPD